MGNRTAKFVSVLVGSIIAGAPLAAVSQNAPTAPTASSTANAAGDCLASPKGAAPQGQHWYYRLERSTKQKCWYLRAAGDKVTRTAQAAPDAKVAQDTDSAAPQTVQNARAEFVAQQTGAAPGAPNMTAPAPAAQQPPATAAEPAAVATRWPDPTTASAPPAPQPAQAAPAPQPAPAPAVTAATAPPSAKPSKSPVAFGAADSSIDKPHGSLPTLLLVIGGALALAGLLGSLIYRFAGKRARRVKSTDRHAYWDHHATQDQEASRAPWLGANLADVQPRPIDFDAARPQASRQVTKLAAIGRELDLIDARKQRAVVRAPEPDEIRSDEVEIKMFDRKFEIQAASPQLVAKESGEEHEAPTGRDQDAVDVDVVTTMLERLAKEGPRLSRPNLEADLAKFERSLRGRSAARA
ncbi:hypothetical protein [Bradyrhizobium sp. 1(2017)]|uniref:hypothetical protein n=1 Tax=Bradyrhizobium sp. 1(2017) TaxID=1404888 RepID=UPI00140E98D1|nr:hypothetical protein [Bradyrhizobium sp. 1(2017)]QIO34475.1 hypothetical protein HAP40_23060 [Bradyrhizobium sp. 1(2017)]